MTQYFSSLTLEALNALTLDDLAEMGLSMLVLTPEHTPYQVLDAEDFNSRYFIEDADDWST